MYISSDSISDQVHAMEMHKSMLRKHTYWILTEAPFGREIRWRSQGKRYRRGRGFLCPFSPYKSVLLLSFCLFLIRTWIIFGIKGEKKQPRDGNSVEKLPLSFPTGGNINWHDISNEKFGNICVKSSKDMHKTSTNLIWENITHKFSPKE